MSKLLTIWANKRPKSYQRILFRFKEDRQWKYCQNWKFNFRFSWWVLNWHWNVITPFFRFQKCNGQVTFGLGNHYIEIGY